MIVREGHPSLRRVCPPVTDFSGVRAVAVLLARAATAEKGIGLAAPQIDRTERMFVLKTPVDWLFCVNPSFEPDGPEKVLREEGCLSFPGLFIKVQRFAAIRARWQDGDGRVMEHRFDGIAARCFQHELDHLDGKLFTDGRSVAVAMARKKRR